MAGTARKQADVESARGNEADPTASYVFALVIVVLAFLSGLGLSASYSDDQQASQTVGLAAR